MPGRVSNLKCDYVFKEEKPLRCTWDAPADTSGVPQIYSITVKYVNQVIHFGSTAGTSYKNRPDFIPTPKLKHEVIVRAMTKPKSPSASTILRFLDFGKLK